MAAQLGMASRESMLQGEPVLYICTEICDDLVLLHMP